ncbi:allantoinase [Histoplasma capsulatum var. duboisii H88]|uniref:Allantoinase n=1 Tax=Ajellomyces capsulatus (strain H88) TaxID=544711 RepID=F0U6X3_AJEC8|nr:allantoinase [Histoplasma capsulatum var. duboisii H88]QSS51255.1 allantoinase [Histoplasma capsulatum var. duboisii H88]
MEHPTDTPTSTTPAPTPTSALATGADPASSLIVLTSTRAIISGRLTAATIVISLTTGKVTSVFHSVLPPTAFPPGTPYTDYSPYILMPGLVDAHVHLNEPGRTEWEGFETGTRAAAFGGVTTLIDMPLNAIPPTTTVEALREKIAAAAGKCWVDVGFYGGVVPGNVSELRGLVEAGVKGFKGFLIDSGVDEFPAVSTADIKAAMLELADLPTTLMFHAEMLPETNGDTSLPQGAPTSYSTFLNSRPSTFETTAISAILSLAPLAPNLLLHIVHLSAMEAIPLLKAARRRGVNITAETCFHYLSLAAEEVGDGDTRHKCCPPIRSQANQDALWEELAQHASVQGVIKTVVSDHSPCTPALKILPAHIPGYGPANLNNQHDDSDDSDYNDNENDSNNSNNSNNNNNTKGTNTKPDDEEEREGEKAKDEDGNFLKAWGGISSVGLGLPILWTELERRRSAANSTATDTPTSTSSTTSALEDIVQWCCANTARQVGLASQKGDLSVGYDGDVCVFDENGEWVVEPDTMLFRNKCSPYQGRRMRGIVRETWLRGQKVYTRDDGFVATRPVGNLLLEPRAS